MQKKYLPKFAGFCAFLLVFLGNPLIGSEFDNEYNHWKGGEIKRFKICGERCSGTNFLWSLLAVNFPGASLNSSNSAEFGQKHFLWWFGTPINNKKLKNLKYSLKDVHLSGSQDCLFVVVVRNPYDWLRSFYATPHHVHEDLYKHSFFNFLSREWKLKEGERWGPIDNYNPWTGKPFINVLELRKYKTMNYLTLGTLVDNYLFVRYEDVRDNPEGFINFVSDRYNLVKNDRFVSVDNYKKTNINYVKKTYNPISERDFDFINNRLDWEVENAVGYFCSWGNLENN